MDSPRPEPLKNLPIDFKAREFFLGIAIAGALVLMITGARSIVRARPTSAGMSCVAVLKQIEGAKSTWALEHQKRTNDIPTWNDIIGPERYIAHMPVCPSNGTYTLGPVGESPRCSNAGHLLP